MRAWAWRGPGCVCICPQPIFFEHVYAQGPLVVKIIQNFEQPVLMEGFVFTAVEYWLLTSLCCKCSTSVWPKVRSSSLIFILTETILFVLLGSKLSELQKRSPACRSFMDFPAALLCHKCIYEMELPGWQISHMYQLPHVHETQKWNQECFISN